MCFAPQGRVLFRQLNLHRWSCLVVFLAFWLGQVLRTTTACTFLTSQLPTAVRPWCVLRILIWRCALCHIRLQCLGISTCKGSPTLVCFVHFDLGMCFAPQGPESIWHRNCNFQQWSDLASLLFDPPEPQTIANTQCFATCAPASSFFWLLLHWPLFLVFSSLTFSSDFLLWLFPSLHALSYDRFRMQSHIDPQTLCGRACAAVVVKLSFQLKNPPSMICMLYVVPHKAVAEVSTKEKNP